MHPLNPVSYCKSARVLSLHELLFCYCGPRSNRMRFMFVVVCRVLTPRPYVSSEVVAQWREAAALTIQRFSRGWFARKRAAVLQGIKAERDAFLAETAAESSQAALEHRR